MFRLCFRAVQFMVAASVLGGGERLEQLVKAGLSHLPANSELAREMFNIFPGLDWSFSILPWTRTISNEPIGYLMAFMIFVIFTSIVAYALCVIITAQAYGYAVIRRIKDDHDIADEESLYFTEEHVNPEVGEE